MKGRENVDAGAAWAEISHQMFPQRVASAEAPSERTLPFKVNFWPGVKGRERERREREQSPPGPSGSVAEQ